VRLARRSESGTQSVWAWVPTQSVGTRKVGRRSLRSLVPPYDSRPLTSDPSAPVYVARGSGRSGPARPTLGFLPLPAEGEAELFFGDFGPGSAGVVVNDAIQMVLGFFGHFADRAFGFKVVG